MLASQVNGIIADLNELSPALAEVYAVLMNNNIFRINESVRTFRDDAWRFVTILAAQPVYDPPVLDEIACAPAPIATAL